MFATQFFLSFPDNLSVCACHGWCESRVPTATAASATTIWYTPMDESYFFRAFLPRFIYIFLSVVYGVVVVWFAGSDTNTLFIQVQYVSSLLAAHTE